MVTEKLSFLLACLSGGILLSAGDVILMKWVPNKDWKLLVAGMLMWALAGLPSAYSFTFGKVVIASILVNLLNVLILCVVSAVMLNQTLSAREWVGVGLAVAALVVLRT